MLLEPIAIIGIGCRFPGADSPEAFWKLLREGIDAVTEVPKSRWNVDEYYDPDPSKPDKTNTRWGGFLEQVDQFDPYFFGIAPKEVATMDPQQRLILEVAWEAIEDALQIPSQLVGTKTGVFVGIGSHDYSIMLWQNPVNNPYGTTGTANSIAANRISYILDLKGPSLAVDTACSSSLVAVHLACQSIWCGESTIALAGGVNVLLLPNIMVGFTKSGLMSGDGRCKSFDAQANGYVRSEGAGMVVLKPLQQASADGDLVYAVIRGSGVNQDGHSQGMAAPNQTSQISLLRETYQRAGISPSQIQYIEAHGTGTNVGDRVELEAMSIALSENRLTEQKCAIGSVKTNIGHLETASGIAGLIKVALSLNNRQIPPNLHFLKPNPAIDLANTPFSIQQRLTFWPEQDSPRIAGINSFGFGGTNAHVILQEAPLKERKQQIFVFEEKPLHLLALSAKTYPALQDLAIRYCTFLKQHPVTTISDICWSNNTKRSLFNHRLIVMAENEHKLAENLAAFAANQGTKAWKYSQVSTRAIAPQIVFMFTGQGSQLIGMGKELYDTQPLFRRIIDQCAEILEDCIDIHLLEILYPSNPDSTKIDETAYAQPALFAIEYALAQLWMSWGIIPSVVLGHSFGEYVAACTAGVFSLEDGLRLVAERGKLIQTLPLDGAMISVIADEETIRISIADYSGIITIAAINGDRSWVLSGQKAAIDSLTASLVAKGIKTTPLKVSHAFHSPLMQPVLTRFRKVAAKVTYYSPKINLISNLTGDFINDEVATPQYWSLHLCQTVQFTTSIATLQKHQCDILIEIGPQPTLLAMARSIWNPSSVSPQWLPSLRPNHSDWQQLLLSLGELYLTGIPINFSGLDLPRHLVRLPTYPFQRQSFGWTNSYSFEKKEDLFHHPLLSKKIVSNNEVFFRSHLNSLALHYLKDHRLDDVPILPAAAYLEMALAIASQLYSMYGNEQQIFLTNLHIEQPFLLSEEGIQTLDISLKPEISSSYSLQIFSKELKTRHVYGQIGLNSQSATVFNLNLAQAQQRCIQPVSVVEHYQKCKEQGLFYGLAFQGLQKLWCGEDSALGWIELPDFLETESNSYLIHPALLDACFQVLGTIVTGAEKDTVYLPFSVDSLLLYQPSSRNLWSYVSLTTRGKTIKANLQLWNEKEEMIADIQGLSLKPVNRQSLAQSLVKQLSPTKLNNSFFEVVWQSSKRNTNSKLLLTHWLIFADEEGVALQFADLLRKESASYFLIFPGHSYSKSEQGYTINPNRVEDFQTLFADLPTQCEGIIYLWQKKTTTEPNLTTLQQSIKLGCASVLYLIQILYTVQRDRIPYLWLVTRGSLLMKDKIISPDLCQSSLWGLGKVIRLEHPDLRCTSLLLNNVPSTEDAPILYQEIMFPDGEDQIAYHNGDRYVPHLVPIKSSLNLSNQPLQLKISQYNSLENLTLVPLTRHACVPDEVEIQVYAVGLNFRDVLNGLGMLQPYLEEMGFADAREIPFGGECAGKIIRIGESVQGFQVGDEVIAAFALGSLANFVRVKSQFVILKPKFLSFLEAATIPSAFLTAYYGLHYLGQIQKGEKILIHSAAGGVGQAAVQLAQKVGAEIFTTASTAKWEGLRSMGIQYTLNSRTLDFADEIMQLTEGQGVDVILNSLNGDFIAKNLEILANKGRFIEIGKIGIWDEQRIEQARDDISYYPFDLLTISQNQPELIANMLTELMELFKDGSLKPLAKTVFTIEESADAFRYMAGARHFGKVVISIPFLSIEEDCAYLITGGWGDLGLKVAHWLIQRGAKYLILVGRSQPSSEREEIIRQLEQPGVTVKCVRADIADSAQVNSLVAKYSSASKRNKKNPEIKGIIHAAGFLDDGMLLNQTWERFETVMNPKIAGAWNLHHATRNSHLDFFVCFSSIVSLVGSPGQGNYVAANSFMDSLMHYRLNLGLPGLSINWGPWAETDMVAPLNTQNGFRAKGISLIDFDWGLEVLGQLIEQNKTQIGVLQVDWSKFLEQQTDASSFLRMVKTEYTEYKDAIASSQAPIKSQLPAKKTINFGQKNDLIVYLQTQLAKVLGFGLTDTIAIDQDFSDFGLDSLMAVEFGNILQADLGILMPPNLISDCPTIALLANYLIDKISDNFEEQMLEQLASADNISNLNIGNISPQFYQFELGNEYRALEQDLEEVKQLGNLFFTIHDGVSSNTITIKGQELINYSSYNYLGLSGNEQVSKAAKNAIEKYGTSVSASRVLSGEISLHQELEGEIADFLGTESCIVYIGGHTTNVSTIGHLFQKNDLILYDTLSHNSVQQGCLLSGATAMQFPHNDWRGLEQLLQQYRLRYEKVLIVIEGIYSSEGDITPLPEMIALKKRYKTFLMVDEAHSIGVLGASGRGIGEYFGISRGDVDLWMGTLSKTFASCGGYIAASDAIVRYLKYTSPGFVFSVGISPPNAAAALSSLRLIKSEPERIKLLQERSKFFLSAVKNLNLNTGLSIDSPIIPIIVGERSKAVNLSNSLLRQGINVQPMVYPSVPYDAARLRFFMALLLFVG